MPDKNFIPRPSYLEKIKPYIGKNLIKVFTGQRRVGKSYLMFQVIDYIKKNFQNPNIIYISKELHKFDDINTYSQLYNYIKQNSRPDEKNYVFIDEIQDISGFENALRSLAAEENYDIYCTGSNSDLLSGELATYLTGRYIQISVYPLIYTEFLKFHNLQDTQQSLNSFIKYGGLPYLKNLILDDDIVYDYLSNVYQAILLKDIVRRFKVRNIDFLERLIVFLAKNTGNLFSARNIVKFLKTQNINISVSAVLDYLQHLQTAFLINPVKRLDLRGKRLFEVGEKYYFTDIGLRNAIAGFSPFELGQIIENIVYLQLRAKGYSVLIGKDETREIDFVAQDGGKRLYIQVALRITEMKTFEREFSNLKRIKDHFPKLVITLDEFQGTSYEGIRHMPLREFLTTDNIF